MVGASKPPTDASGGGAPDARIAGEPSATARDGASARDVGRSPRALRDRLPLRSSQGILLATILLFVLSVIVQPESLSGSALSGMIPFASVLALVALGQTLVIQQGGIDLSVPGIVSLSGVIVSYYSSNEPGMGGSTLGLAIIYALAAALIAGLVNGLLVSRARVAPIVATIGMNAVLYGVDVNVSGGTPVQVPESLSRFVDYKILGVTSLAYIAVAAAVLVTFLIKKTVFGRTFEAVGANARAARAAGVVASRYQLAAYAGAAVLYCMGGIFLGGLMHVPSAFQGDSYLMPSIAAVVLGGTSLFGGAGNLTATLIAAFFLTQLQQLVLTTDAGVGVQFLFQGGAIVVGVGVYSLKLNRLTELLRTLGGRRLVPRGASGSNS